MSELLLQILLFAAVVNLLFTVAGMFIFIHYLRQYGKGLKEHCKYALLYLFHLKMMFICFLQLLITGSTREFSLYYVLGENIKMKLQIFICTCNFFTHQPLW